MQEFECVGNSDGSSFRDCLDAMIVVECWCKVPCSNGVVPPSLALIWLDMNHYFRSDGCHWHPVKGEHAFHGLICGEKWVGSARAEHVQSDVSLL